MSLPLSTVALILLGAWLVGAWHDAGMAVSQSMEASRRREARARQKQNDLPSRLVVGCLCCLPFGLMIGFIVFMVI